MSERQDSDEQTDAPKVKGGGKSKHSRYLGIIKGGLAAFALHLWDRVSENTSEKKQQRADEHLIAAATDRMASYNGWLVAATMVSVATAALNLWVLWSEHQGTEAAQRAFLFVSDVSTLPTVDDSGNKILRIFPKWTNSGDTPTQFWHVATHCTADPRAFAPQYNKNGNPGIVGPKQSAANGNCDFSVPKNLELRSGRVGLGHVPCAKAVVAPVSAPMVRSIPRTLSMERRNEQISLLHLSL
jgi:hypothetical protein